MVRVPILFFSLCICLSVCQAQVSFTQNTFAFIGDYGTDDSDEDSLSQLVKSWGPEAIITLGDNNYPDGNASDIDANIGKYFHEYIRPYSGIYGAGADSNRFFPALGNHDLMIAGGAAYFNYFQLPGNERYYDFVNGDIHFFCLNSDMSEADGCTDSSLQAGWLKGGLQNSVSRWNIVYAHHSPYCSDSMYGNHHHMQWPFGAWGADILLTAHAHVYERLSVDNFPYIVCGLGGQSKYDFNAVPEPGSVVRYNEKYGAIQLKATHDTLYFRFFTVSHELIDSLFLVKPPFGTEGRFSSPCKVYPNPTTGSVYIDVRNWKDLPAKICLTLRDMLGNALVSEILETGKNSRPANLILPARLPPGVYDLHLQAESQQSDTRIVLVR